MLNEFLVSPRVRGKTEILQQKVYGASRAQYHMPVMFKGSNPP